MLFRELAVPRLVGTPNHQKVREVLKRELAARGFTALEHRFFRRRSNAFWGFHAPIDGINLIAQRPSGGWAKQSAFQFERQTDKELRYTLALTY